MLRVYKIIQNLLIFFFVWAIFRKSLLIGGGQFIDELTAAIIFGVLISFTPNLLKFFKLPVNWGSTFLITLIVTFLYLFIQFSVFNNINLTGQNLLLGIDFLGEVSVADKTYALVMLSSMLSIISTLMEYLKKK